MWLTLVTLAFNYNTWFMTARLCFPYHTPEWIPYWIAMDLVADFIYLIDSIFFQARKQFVKGGDVVVSPSALPFSPEEVGLLLSLNYEGILWVLQFEHLWTIKYEK